MLTVKQVSFNTWAERFSTQNKNSDTPDDILADLYYQEFMSKTPG